MTTKIMELKLKGKCCSQIIMQLGLEHLGKENSDLIASMVGLGGGVRQGEICGALSAAICFIYLRDRSNKDKALELSKELTEWFTDVYGSVRCNEILDGNNENKTTVCPPLIENTYLKLMAL